VSDLASLVAAVPGATPAGTNFLGYIGLQGTNTVVLGAGSSSVGTVTLGAGSALAGSVNIATSTTGGATWFHAISTASTNSTLLATGPHTLYGFVLTGVNTTQGNWRFYDSATAPACSSATGAVSSIPVVAPSTGGQGGLIVPIPAQGVKFLNGIAWCVTGGSADNDNTSAPVGVTGNGFYQ
jgi:hypothetical protein